VSSERLFLTVDEAAGLLEVEPDRVRRALAKAASVFFPRSRLKDAEWQVHVADLREIAGGKAEQLYSVRGFAALIGFNYFTVSRAVSLGVIRHEIIRIGVGAGEKRIPESEYWRLRGKRAPRPFSFFATVPA
jgi:hypothetical protein